FGLRVLDPPALLRVGGRANPAVAVPDDTPDVTLVSQHGVEGGDPPAAISGALAAVPCGTRRGHAPAVQVDGDRLHGVAIGEALEYFTNNFGLLGVDLIGAPVAVGFPAGRLPLPGPTLEPAAGAARDLAPVVL